MAQPASTGSPNSGSRGGKASLQHLGHIAANPVKAGTAGARGEFTHCYINLAKEKAAAAKASRELHFAARLKPCPDTRQHERAPTLLLHHLRRQYVVIRVQ